MNNTKDGNNPRDTPIENAMICKYLEVLGCWEGKIRKAPMYGIITVA